MKIVYFKPDEKISKGIFQEELQRQIETIRDPSLFSCFDIYQHIDKNKKYAQTEKISEIYKNLPHFNNQLREVKRQLLFFSGNLTFINAKRNGETVFEVIEDLIKKGVKIKILTRIGFDSKENVEKMLSLNYKYGKELVEIRHYNQCLRVTIFDDVSINLKETVKASNKIAELDEDMLVYYTINDKKWVKWMIRIFNNMFNKGVSHQKRFEELKEFEF
jgi:hypothetical protein